jgi:hypothetical protein
MNVKQAVASAKRYIGELYSEEGIANVGLEEVDFDSKAREWEVTIGFSRPWDEAGNSLLKPGIRSRSYKVVRVSDATGDVRSVKDRLAFVA